MRDIPATPATPRFGSFGDLPDLPRKGQNSALSDEHSTYRPTKHNPPAPSRSTHRRKRSINALATPRQTPRKRHETDSHADNSSRISVDTDLLERLKAPDPQQTAVNPPHPHQDVPPPDVPGMWYVFRGKKVFRPLPPGEKPIRPVTLFKKELSEKRTAESGNLVLITNSDESGSEADTDKEWD